MLSGSVGLILGVWSSCRAGEVPAELAGERAGVLPIEAERAMAGAKCLLVIV